MTAALPARYGIVTVGDGCFVIGALVAIDSFLRSNPWFAGDIVVIDNHLEERERDAFRALCPRIRFVPPSDMLRERIGHVTARIPRLRGVFPRFFALDLFQFSEYDRLVHLDGDTLCLGDVSELFVRSEPLLACPDSAFYAGMVRCVETHEQMKASDAAGRTILSAPFNSGVLSVGRRWLNPETHARLCAMVEPSLWIGGTRGILTDQRVLNYFFRDDYTRLSASYNFVYWLERLIELREGVRFLDARILHFADRFKPWHAHNARQVASVAPMHLKHLDLWTRHYRRTMQRLGAAADAPQAEAGAASRPAVPPGGNFLARDADDDLWIPGAPWLSRSGAFLTDGMPRWRRMLLSLRRRSHAGKRH